ncbi:MAG TPA: sugar ABC transporter permease [Candidatus Brachybacterium merdavium]|uniref:Sugar ABC transporter permease n=1 Tax=Candidatus Brachybacterium merdavium TaxID=2838513 RepID=A0A9D2LE17_9MICO|nr:sugar ABC transporter permease [Candidatus Brachybacterium merdavium]
MVAAPSIAPSDAPRRGRGGRRRLTPQRALFFALFLGAPLLLYILFVVWPVLQAIFYSLTNWRGLAATPEFIGLDNYVRLFNDGIFRQALVNNLILLIVLPTVVITLAFVLAVLVTVGGNSRGQIRGVGGANLYRMVSFFPYVVPAVVVGILFAFIYSPNGGLLNGMLGLVGLNPGIGWLGHRDLALWAIMAAVVWSLVGFYMVLFVAAIKAVPSEIVEAARLDGCGRFRLAVGVILPMIRENVSTAAVYMGIVALDMFVYIRVMTPNGGTGKSTEVISRYLYETAFQKSQFGLASAMGVVLALVTMLMAVIVLFGFRRKDS